MLTRSDVIPLLSGKTNILKSRALPPILAVTAAALAMLYLLGGMRSIQDALLLFDVIGGTLLVIIFYFLYLSSGETENSLRYWLVGLLIYLQCIYLYWQAYAKLFRQTLNLGEPSTYEGERWQIIWNYFVSAGLCEELLKALPILACLSVALLRKRDGSLLDWFALKGPLDGFLMGVAAALIFTMWETLDKGGYVQGTVIRGGNNVNGLLYGVLLMLPRVLDSFSGHVGYSGIFGYFIGLAATHPSRAGRLVLFGWVVSAALHGLWDGVPTDSIWWLVLPGGMTAILFAACFLKARQLDAPRLAATGSGSILAWGTGGQRLASGIVPGTPSGFAGAISTVADAFGRGVGVEARTTPMDARVPPSGLAIGTERVRYALEAGRPIDFSALFAADGIAAGYAGSLEGGAAGLELRNVGPNPWVVAGDTGVTASVPPGASVRPAPGMRLAFGGQPLDVVAFAS